MVGTSLDLKPGVLSGVWPVPARACLPDAPGACLQGRRDVSTQTSGQKDLSCLVSISER